MLKPPEPPLDRNPPENDDEPIGQIVSRLIDEGRDYAKAEVRLAASIATAKARGYKLPAILAAAALLFAQAAVVVLCVALFLALLPRMGPLLAGITATLIALGVAAGLVFVAVNKLRAAK